jgi:predicted CXXCH cytochrome family protein
LLGQHRVVKCGECHGTDLNSKPEHTNCTSCHKDYHKGEFIASGKSGECSDCHTVSGFSPSLFTLELHQKTRFPLAGSHLAQSCQSCHYSGSEWKFKKDNIECSSCHNNIHGNEISAKFMGNNNCSNCHNVENWLKYSFDHEKTEFKLTGKHASKKCYDCHKKEESTTPPVRKFASLNTYCESCHKEVHNYQFKSTGENDCLKCHTTSNWKAEKFDHNNTRFSLTGAHSLIECEKCHKEAESNGVKFVKYKIEDFKCATCHY